MRLGEESGEANIYLPHNRNLGWVTLVNEKRQNEQ